MRLFPQTGLRLTSHSRPPSRLRLLGGEQGPHKNRHFVTGSSLHCFAVCEPAKLFRLLALLCSLLNYFIGLIVLGQRCLSCHAQYSYRPRSHAYRERREIGNEQ